MTGVAAGLALSGKVVFTYSIANFPTFRCLEQIRNDLCYARLPVKIVAVGGGLAYGAAGYSHHAVEDLAVMGALPHLRVLAPGDPAEVRLAVREVLNDPGPCYLRIGKGGEACVHPAELPAPIDRAIRLRDGHDVTLIACGGILSLACAAAETLAADGMSVELLSMPSLKPFDEDAVLAAARKTGRILTIEEHGWGGLGTRAAEVLARSGAAVKFAPMRLSNDLVAHEAGSQAQLRAAHGLTVEAIVERARGMVRG
jgi:transketolase